MVGVTRRPERYTSRNGERYFSVNGHAYANPLTGSGTEQTVSEMSLASLRRRTSSAIDAAPILVDLLDLLGLAGHRTHL